MEHVRVFENEAATAGSCNACTSDHRFVKVIHLSATPTQTTEIRLCRSCAAALKERL